MRIPTALWGVVLACGMGSLLLPSALAAQQITVGSTVTISADAPADPHGESFYAINPKNSKNQLATSCRISADGMGSVAYVTHDGGQTWSRVALPSTAAKVLTGWDAIAYFDADGTAYYGANDGDGLYITHSTDEGRTWSAATLLQGSRGFDRQYMGFDRTGRFAGRIYAGASVTSMGLDGKGRSALAVAFSTDRATTFGQPRLISSLEDETVFTFVNMLITPDGTVILPFTTRAEMKIDPKTLWKPQDPSRPETRPEPQYFFRLATSGDGGASYSISPRLLSFKQSGDVYRSWKTQGQGNTAIDLSDGPFRGRIYYVWVDYAGDRYNIRVIHSSDNGKTWSEPVTVNDNTNPADDANPTIAVNNRGVVGVTWNDRRNHKDECYDLYFSASLDGGDSFLPNVTTGGAATCPNAHGNWLPSARISPYPMTEQGHSIEGQGLNVLMISTRFPGGGDTQGLDSDAEGVFHAGWIGGASGVMQLATTPFTVQGPVQAASSKEQDISTQVKLVAEKCGFNWQEKTFSCSMHLVNKSPLPVDGPFTVELQNMRVNLTDFHVENADNGKKTAGARWEFKAPGGGSRLLPGSSTASRPFIWRFTGIPPQPEYPFMMFKVVSTGVDRKGEPGSVASR